MKILLTLISLFINLVVLSQNTSLVFISNEENFILFLDGVKQITTPTTYIRVNNFNKTSTEVKISFTDNNTAPLITTINFDAGGEIHYDITKKEDLYELIWKKRLALDAVLPIGEGQMEVNYVDAEGKEHFPFVKKEGYEGNKGCEKAMSLGETKQIFDDLHQFHHPDEKYKAATKWLKNRCITTDNAIKIVQTFKNEYYEEKFAVFIYKYTYDLDNFNNLLDALSENAAKNAKSTLGL